MDVVAVGGLPVAGKRLNLPGKKQLQIKPMRGITMVTYSGNLKPDQVLLPTATKAAVAGGSEGRRSCSISPGKLPTTPNSLG